MFLPLCCGFVIVTWLLSPFLPTAGRIWAPSCKRAARSLPAASCSNRSSFMRRGRWCARNFGPTRRPEDSKLSAHASIALSLFRLAPQAAAYATREGGAASIAAHHVAFQLWLFLAFLADSLGTAGQALVARSVGECDVNGARQVVDRLLQVRGAVERWDFRHRIGLYPSASESANPAAFCFLPCSERSTILASPTVVPRDRRGLLRRVRSCGRAVRRAAD